jgi:hypothetical protein
MGADMGVLELHQVAENASGVVLTGRTDKFLIGEKWIALPVMGSFDFQGDKNATYEVMKSPDLSTGSFAPLATPLTVTTNGVGIGQAIVPASETTPPSTFFRLEER